VIFTVSDNGIGMDTESREKAFSLFFSTKGTEGTGLGLFVADKIAKAHGGRIGLESAPGMGTRFTVELPRDLRKHQAGRIADGN
ncbi:MAG: sensor histidine kinase, partial [Deltaproteobacteria bacterium]